MQVKVLCSSMTFSSSPMQAVNTLKTEPGSYVSVRALFFHCSVCAARRALLFSSPDSSAIAVAAVGSATVNGSFGS